ncbi:MAG: hypothetical protein ISQ24_04515 [PS1 clade bacterium]|nr:hypothetical protein [PS1 clade bacterium]MBL6784297.1 hypothetical protein [PS1 clade bacterium]
MLSNIAAFFGRNFFPGVVKRYVMANKLENLLIDITHRSETPTVYTLIWDDDLRQSLLTDEKIILDLKIDALKRMKYEKETRNSVLVDAYLAESTKKTLPLPELSTIDILLRAENFQSYRSHYANADDQAYVKCHTWVVRHLANNATASD